MSTPEATTRIMRKLLFVNHSMRTGGIETMIRDFANGVDPSRFEPLVAVFQGGGPLIDELEARGVPVADLRKREGLDFRVVTQLRQLLRRQKIEVIHSHNYSAWLYSVLASWGTADIRLVHTEHSRVQPMARRHMMERWLARRTHRVVGVSADVVHSLVHDVGMSASKICLITNGVNLSRYRSDPDLRRETRQRLRVADDAIVFGIVARLVPIKSHTTLIDAFAMVHKELPSARLVVAGDGSCLDALKRQVADFSLADSVAFLGEVRDTDEVLNGLDVYMLASTNEGMNLTLLEAMATGLCVVATAVGGNTEVVAEGETGLLVPPSDPGQMARAMVRLARDPQLRATLGAAGRQRVEEYFSQTVTLRTYMSLYDGEATPTLSAV